MIQLKALAQLEREAHKCQQVALQASQERESVKQELHKIDGQRQQKQADIEQFQHKLEQQVGVQQQIGQLEAQIKSLAQWQALNQELEQAQKGLERQKLKGKQLSATHQKVQQQAKSLQLRWHQGQAAILAKELEPGAPCPVCGSLAHPQPAQSNQHLPSQAELESAQERESQASAELNGAREEYRGLLSQVQLLSQNSEQLNAELGELTLSSLPELQHSLTALKAQMGELNQLHEQLKQAKSEHQGLSAQTQRLQGELENKELIAQRAHAELSSASGRVEQSKEAIGSVGMSVVEVEHAMAQLSQELERLKEQVVRLEQSHRAAGQARASAEAELKAMAEQLQLAQSLHQKDEQQFMVLLGESPWSSTAAFQQALLGESELIAITQRVELHQNQGVELKAKIEQLTEKLVDVPELELEHFSQALTLAQQQVAEAEQVWQKLHSRYRQLQQTQQQLESLRQSNQALEQEYALVGTLSDVANGQTGNKISLQRFVLSVLLDDVLMAASQRLQLMSKGRYQLIRKEQRAKGNKASGLELEVEDAYTAKVRPVATLSGGESFMAALSMALGVSDVVQAYAGGIRLETLFIDEGFGSLDQESLDLAIRTLVDLQSTGRMVGVISHVSELKEQLTTRIDIDKASSGSAIRFVLP